MIRMLVANLLDIPTPPEMVEAGIPQHPSNRIPEMGSNRLDPTMLRNLAITDGEPGETMRDQAVALRIIYALVADNAKPTPETVERRLTLELSGRNVEDAAQVAHDLVERVKAYRTADGSVEFLAGALAGWRKRRFIESRLEDALRLARGPATDHDMTINLMELMREITPDLTPMEESDHLTVLQNARDEAIRLYDRAREGKSTGPEYPWAQLRELVPTIPAGHVHAVTAPTKHGKTTLAYEIGRHIAMNQKEYMVVLYHLETDFLDLGMRELARNLMLKPGDFSKGKVDLRSPHFSGPLDKVEKEMEAKVGTGRYAKFKLIHCPSLTLQALERDLYKQKTIAKAMGLEGVVVIIDYYQIMDWRTSVPEARDEISGRNEMATRLKDLIERGNSSQFASCDVSMHGVVFAQDSATDHTRKTPWGGQQIVQRAQAHLKIVGYEDVAREKPVIEERGDKRVHLVDGLQRPLYWQREGDVSSERAIRVVRGNQVRPGHAFVRILNGYFRVQELVGKYPDWWPEYYEKLTGQKHASLA